MKFLLVSLLLFTLCSSGFGQAVEVQGQLKVTTVNQNNSTTDVLMKDSDGTITKRDAATIEKQGTAIGDMKYWDGSVWTLLPVGSPGQTLKVSPSNIPQWENDGKTYIIIQGDITDAQAAAQLANEVGTNTQFIWVQNTTALTSLNLNGITSLIELKIINNTALANVSTNGLLNVVNSIEVYENPNLLSLAMPFLTRTRTFNCSYHSALTSFSLPQLVTIDAFFICSDNTALISLTVPVLTACLGFNCYNNAALTSLTLPALTTNNEFNCYNNAALISLSLPVLATSNGFNCNSNAALISLSLPVLATSNGFNCDNNAALTSLSLPSLTNSGFFDCRSNAALVSLSLPSLVTYTSTFFRASANKLPSSNINSLLATFVALGTTPLNEIRLENQTPPAPPTGQGIIDKDTLIAMGKTVITD